MRGSGAFVSFQTFLPKAWMIDSLIDLAIEAKITSSGTSGAHGHVPDSSREHRSLSRVSEVASSSIERPCV